MPIFSLTSIASSVLPPTALADVSVRLDARLDKNLWEYSASGLIGSAPGVVSYSDTLAPTGTHSLIITNTDGATKVFVDFDNVPAPNAATPGITVALWLRVTGVATTATSNIASVVFDIGQPAASGSNGFALMRTANQAFDPDGLIDKTYTIRGGSNLTLRDNVWQHLVFTANRDSQTVNWFRNGVSMTPITGAQIANYPAVVDGLISKVRIGHAETRTDVRGLIGQVDRFMLYNGAIDAASAAALVSDLSQVNDMTVYYDFDNLYISGGTKPDANGTVFRNVATGSTNTAISATLRNACVIDTTAKYGASLGAPSGVNTYSRCSGEITLAAGQHTFSMWFLLKSTSEATSTSHLLAWTNNNNTTESVGVGVRIGTPNTLWILSDGLASDVGVQVYSTSTAATVFDLNNWHHVVAVFTTSDSNNSGNASCQVYLNGKPQVKNNFSSQISTTVSRKYRDFMVRIGFGYTFGNIDEFRYFPRGITEAEVITLYGKTQA